MLKANTKSRTNRYTRWLGPSLLKPYTPVEAATFAVVTATSYGKERRHPLNKRDATDNPND
jgi:hypothetical protein